MYKFKERLIEGLIKKRPNRFLMDVEIDGELIRCHCPSTGKIGNLNFLDIPCLLSKSDNLKRKTPYTVEAISLDSPKKKIKSWHGINQVKANAYVDHFLKEGKFIKIFKEVHIVEREVPLGKSRLDFLVDTFTYMEVKTLLKNMPCDGHPQCKEEEVQYTDLGRLMRHFQEMTMALKKGHRAILALVYLYDAEVFKVPPSSNQTSSEIKKVAAKAERAGLDNWQINFKVTPKGVELLDYFPLKLFK
jgi:sugar fermentation stimulation protein A